MYPGSSEGVMNPSVEIVRPVEASLASVHLLGPCPTSDHLDSSRSTSDLWQLQGIGLTVSHATRCMLFCTRWPRCCCLPVFATGQAGLSKSAVDSTDQSLPDLQLVARDRL